MLWYFTVTSYIKVMLITVTGGDGLCFIHIIQEVTSHLYYITVRATCTYWYGKYIKYYIILCYAVLSYIGLCYIIYFYVILYYAFFMLRTGVFYECHSWIWFLVLFQFILAINFPYGIRMAWPLRNLATVTKILFLAK